MTLKLALKVRDLLNADYTGHQLMLSRTTDATLSLKQRTDMANNWGADYLCSIHINAGGGTGYEDYIYNGPVQSTTVKLRDTMHSEIVNTAYKDVRNRGKKKANFHMLRESRMPAMLSENLFIDHASDAAKLKSDAYLTNIARGHVNGLVKAFNLQKKSSPAPGKLYKVQIGAFKNKANADQLAARAKAKGFDQYVVRQDGLYKVQIGAYAKKANAEAQAAKAKKAGFETYIVYE